MDPNSPDPSKWTKKFAMEVLLGDINLKYAIAVKKIEDGCSRKLNQAQRDALVSFAYNLGPGAIEKSTFWKQWIAGASAAEVGELMLRFNKARVNGKLTVLAGLTRRRKAEGALFAGDPNWRRFLKG